MKIGIFGGTFNPPHIGHIQAATSAAQQLGLDLLIIVPAGLPPHKELPAGTPTVDMRLDMARAAFKDRPDTVVVDTEVLSDGPNYTIDTVSRIRREYPDAVLYLLVGTDMFLTLESWRDSETLLRTVTPAVFSRSRGDMEEISEYAGHILDAYSVKTEIIKTEVIEVSSSQLREMLPERKGTGYIDDTNYSYIIKHRLYRAKPDWDWLRARAHSMLNLSRIPHVDGCEAEAVRLAGRWNVDADDAREAAILHDITKKLSTEENLKILREFGIEAENIGYGGEKLLHSKTGALLAGKEFGVSKTVADAIMWHTTGNTCMSELEKIIYLADYIEPTRDFDGVGPLRTLAYESLNEAMIMGLEMSVEDMKMRGITPNRATFEALDYLKTNERAVVSAEGTFI